MEDDHGDPAGPSTYVRGYHRLPQEDTDMLSTSNWDDQTTSQNQQPPPVPLPPYSPVPSYAPAPQTFRTPQQTSSSVSRGWCRATGDYLTLLLGYTKMIHTILFIVKVWCSHSVIHDLYNILRHRVPTMC